MITSSEYNKLINELKPVTCLAISKRRAIAEILQIYDYGQRHFGENYLQELIDKAKQLPQKDIVWHFTGRIQRKKCRQIAAVADWVHSINNIEQLELLSKARPSHKPPLNCCLQVIPDSFAHEYAVKLSQVSELLVALPGINIVGLMAMPEPRTRLEQRSEIFTEVAAFANQVWPQPVLSMGMSADYQIAIAAGANLVRLGSVLFSSK